MLTYDLLKDKQVYEIEQHLKKKILRHTLVPSDREVEQIDLGKMNKHLPYGYVIPEELKKCYARLYRFVTHDGDTLKINHDLYGNYLFQHYYKLTQEERQALFDFDIMLEMINQDIASLRAVSLPAPLATPEAMLLWQKAMAAGWVDECFQPKLSITLSAMLAFEIAIRLELKDKWKTFETFWHRNNMRSNYNSALKQRQSLKFQDRIKQVFK